MRSQLAFSWRSAGVERARRDDEQLQVSPRREDASGRRVTFAVQNVPPSPLVYHTQYHSSGDGDERDAGGEREDVKQSISPRESSRQPPVPAKPPLPTKRAMTAKRGATAAAYSTKATPKPRARPGWDDQVARDSSLFDTSLKRSVLFQARPGDRKRQVGDEKMHVRDRHVLLSKQGVRQLKQSTGSRRPSAVSGGKMRRKWGETQSSGYMAPSSYQLPPKPKKDYVKENIERIVGRPVEMLRNDKRPPRRGRSKNVFERLTAPRVNDLLVQTHGWSSNTARAAAEDGTGAVRNAVMSQPATPDQILLAPCLVPDTMDRANERDDSAQASVVLEQRRSLLYPETQPSRGSSDRSGSPSSSTRFPQQQGAYRHAARRSGSPRSPPTSGLSRNPRTAQQPSYAARVFTVLDRDERKRIGVDQVLQGLRLLGLPATHNQISDYIYLIHEGRSTTIDLEEWEILVGTLDAASRPADSVASLACVETSSERSAFSLESLDRGSIHSSPPPSSSRLKSCTHARRSASSSVQSNVVDLSRHSSPSYGHGSLPKLSPDHHHQGGLEVGEDIDDPAVRSVQRCVDEMCQQAGAAASLRWTTGTSRNNQTEDDTSSSSRHILNHAAAVVYNLKASLFPLVHQAEETLKEIRQRQGYKLSVMLSPEDLQVVARNSEMLASAILDDVLLDTVQLLNDEEKHQSQREITAHHVAQLDEILSQIQQIEQDELQLVAQQTVPPFTTPAGAKVSGWDSGHAVAVHDNPAQDDGHRTSGSDASKLILPLEVLMNVKIPDEEEQIERSPHESLKQTDSSVFSAPSTTVHLLLKELGLICKLPAIKTSILQGRRLQSIEKRRTKFFKHRRLVEAALANTGMAQSAVIEILEELMVMDIIEEAAAELEDTVGTISDTVVANLL